MTRCFIRIAACCCIAANFPLVGVQSALQHPTPTPSRQQGHVSFSSAVSILVVTNCMDTCKRRYSRCLYRDGASDVHGMTEPFAGNTCHGAPLHHCRSPVDSNTTSIPSKGHAGLLSCFDQVVPPVRTTRLWLKFVPCIDLARLFWHVADFLKLSASVPHIARGASAVLALTVNC